MPFDKKSLSERDICTKYITPAILNAGWDMHQQLREEVTFTDGRIYVQGKITARGKKKRADYILYYKPNIPIAVIEAKDNHHSIGAGIQQALSYAQTLDVPFVFSSNGDGFLFHDRTASGDEVEQLLQLHEFPSREVLWQKYLKYKNIQTPREEKLVAQDYFYDGSGRSPRYYQQIAINRTVEAIAKGQQRILLVMATGTGKTYTAFQIAHRLWKAGAKKRILFLADRTALIEQTRRNDFKHFRDKMTILKKKVVQINGREQTVSSGRRGIDSADKAYEIFLGLYQGLSSSDPGAADAYKDFSPDFFDLVIVDECHRGSAREDSAWRGILEYFKSATHIGLTATPKETEDVSNIEYFGDPVYTYSLRQGINDGFLAPYRVVRVHLNIDSEGWRPPKDKLDKTGNPVEDRIYSRKDFDRTLVVEERTALVAKKVTEFLKGYDRFAKTIVFCNDIEHAGRMRTELVRQNADLAVENWKYVVQITGDNEEGKRELDNFITPDEKYPVIATTSELMTTGVDAQTCKVIVLDAEIQSMTKFKQIIGRGTRINEAYDKRYFTILDFRNATDLFADPSFDGDPIRVKEAKEGEDLTDVTGEEETGEPIIDEETGEEIVDPPPGPPYPPPPPPPNTGEGDDGGTTSGPPVPRQKITVNEVDVSVLVTRELYFDHQGKPITISLKDHTKGIILKSYASLDDFLNKWQVADRKEALMQELREAGILVDALYAAVDQQLDLFDLICHIAYDQPPLTRRERANNVRKRNYFTKYGEGARQVLEALLEKYADEGIENIEQMDVLRVQPLTELGSPTEIVRSFGGKQQYLDAVRGLEEELYKIA